VNAFTGETRFKLFGTVLDSCKNTWIVLSRLKNNRMFSGTLLPPLQTFLTALKTCTVGLPTDGYFRDVSEQTRDKKTNRRVMQQPFSF
jgi:hypothetical protein